MKNKFIAMAMATISLPCFAYHCFDSSEYKESLKIAQNSHREIGDKLATGVAFLMKTKGINEDQALKEVMQRKATPETLAYDEALKKLGEKIQAFKPQSPEDCANFIKLQREYEKIGDKKIEFIVNEVMAQPVPNSKDINELIK